MRDIFEAKIYCKNCNVEMKPATLEKNGFKLRSVQCPKCNERIVHPSDLNNLKHYNDLKKKTFNVKLRIVGNSHAVSIPKEIVDFINSMHHNMRKQVNDMVKLCFEDFGRISLQFIDEDKTKW